MAHKSGWFEDAKKVVLAEGKASVSLLQRKLKIGYAAAAGLIEELEQHGVIGPADGRKPREVFKQQRGDSIPSAADPEVPSPDDDDEEMEEDPDEGSDVDEEGSARKVISKDPPAPSANPRGKGRPTTYTEDMVSLGEVYLYDIARDVSVYVGQGRYGSVEREVNLPSIEGFADWLEVPRTTLYEWAEKHPAFSDILERIKTKQAVRLLNKGLGGQYNSHITKLALGKHGYHDKQELMGEGGGPIRHDISGSLRKVYGKKKPAAAAA